MHTNVLFDPGKFEDLTHLPYGDIGESFFYLAKIWFYHVPSTMNMLLTIYVINKHNLHHCKRYSVHCKSKYSMLSCHARSLHYLAKSGVEGIYACLSPRSEEHTS